MTSSSTFKAPFVMEFQLYKKPRDILLTNRQRDSLASYIDLAAMYSNRDEHAVEMLAIEGGKPKVSANSKLPLGSGGCTNDPRDENSIYSWPAKFGRMNSAASPPRIQSSFASLTFCVIIWPRLSADGAMSACSRWRACIHALCFSLWLY
jgi:hypothetical protein